jgi:uncharacterized protein (TIGR03437 family)
VVKRNLGSAGLVQNNQVRKIIIICSIACSLLCFAGVLAWAQTPPSYTITTIAGNGTPGFSGDGGAANAAQLWEPYAAAMVAGNLYISDQVNSRVRIVTGGNINTFAGNGTQGYSGDGSAATSAELFDNTGLTVDGSGNVYVSDLRNQVVRKINSKGTIFTYAGNNTLGAGLSGDAGPASSAQLFDPAGLAVDSKGNLYIADSGNGKVRLVSSAAGNNISTFAGNFTNDFAGDGGPAINAELNNPEGVAVDAAGNVYIADTANHRIRMVTLDGIIHTVAGNGTPGAKGDGGQAVNAELNFPEGVAVDPAGNLYIADTFNQKIRMVQTNGIIVTIAGTGISGYTGDGGPSAGATLSFPAAVSLDSQNNLYVTDSQNNAIRMMTPSSAIVNPGAPSIRAGGVVSASEYGDFANVAPGSWIEISGANLSADTRIWASTDFVGETAPTSLDRVQVTVGGVAGFIYYVSPTQVNVLLPSTVPLGPQPVILTNAGGVTAASTINVVQSLPGLYAPAGLVVGGNQYVGAFFTDGETFVAPPGAMGGITSRRANPGDTIILLGIGFGPTTPVVPDGTVPLENTTLVNPVQINIGGIQAQQTYGGLSPGSVGVYEFSVIVPNIPASDAAQVTFSQGGVPGTQKLFTSVN